MSPSSISWKKVCCLKKEGGLGLRNIETWNLVVVGKLAWHIHHMTKSLWVRWIHGVYTKGANWFIFKPPPPASWVLKKICKARDKLAHWVQHSKCTICDVYKAQPTQDASVSQTSFLWNRASIPKARFVLWLALQNKLKTKDKLCQIGVVEDNICPMCGLTAETVEHMFFKCTFSSKCLAEVSSQLGNPIPKCVNRISI